MGAFFVLKSKIWRFAIIFGVFAIGIGVLNLAIW
jgi:hypothetical protein